MCIHLVHYEDVNLLLNMLKDKFCSSKYKDSLEKLIDYFHNTWVESSLWKPK